MNKTLASVVIAHVALLVLPNAVNAASSEELICAVTRTVECANIPGDLECVHNPAIDSAQPAFLTYNLKKKLVKNTYTNSKAESTPIDNAAQVNDQFMLSGIDGNVHWNSVISINTGKMAATIADSDLVIVVYGNCIIP